MVKAKEATDYNPIKWALIVLGEFDYYKSSPGINAIQKVEHWIQSEGVPYDIIEDDKIEAPTNMPTLGNYTLQYINGTVKYSVFVIIMNSYTDTAAVNVEKIYWAVGNGTNAVIFGMARARAHPGNTYLTESEEALFNLDWVYLVYGDNSKNEPGWFLYSDRKNAMASGGGGERPDVSWRFEALKDAVKTLFPIFGIYAHNQGYYNLTFDVYPPNTAYTDMFRFVHLDESYEFYINSRYMYMNMINAYYKNNKIFLEYKSNSNLTDYVWRFPVEYNNRYFNGLSDNRTMGKIKHIDGKYVYIEFSEGGNERVEALYGTSPHIYRISSYIQNINQIYTPRNLTLQLWNGSGTTNIKVNCTRLGQPNSISINGTQIDFNYNPTTKICSFNVTFSGLKTVELFWEQVPPNPPTLVSPLPASRFNPSKYVAFTWEFSDHDPGESQFMYKFQLSDNYDFASPIIDTGKVMSPSTQTTQTLPNTLALYFWRVKTWDNRDMEGEWSDAQPIIVDRLKIADKGTTNNRANVGTSASVYFSIVREFDNTMFNEPQGAVYINGSAATWSEVNKNWKLNVKQNSIGAWKYQVSNINDPEHHITTINNLAETQNVIWDKLIVTITPDVVTATVGTQVNFVVTAVYAYDNKPVSEFTSNILRDGAHLATNNFTDIFTVASTHQYTLESIIEKSYDLTVFTSNSPTVTWSPKPVSQILVDWIASNILIIILIGQIVIVLSIIIIRERKTRENE